jgi:hypothetical protein
MNIMSKFEATTPGRINICELCDRQMEFLTVHHLIPRQMAKRRGDSMGATIDICGACHKQIHTLFTNRELAQEFNSATKLKHHPGMAKFLHWVRKQDPGKKVRVQRGRG